MHRFAIAVAALIVIACASCAHGAQVLIGGKAPLFDNDGACGAPVLIPQPPTNAALRVVLSWSGPASGRDSTFVQPGAAFLFTKTLTPGLYTFRIYSADAGGAGCDTMFSRTLKAAPFHPSLD